MLSREFGVTGPTIQRHLKSLGLSKDMILDPEQDFNKRMIAMYVEEEMSHEAIGRALGLDGNTIGKRLRRMGIQSRPGMFQTLRPDLTEEELNDLIRKTYEKCLSVKGTMEAVGLGDLETVRKRLHSMGIETNHRKGFRLKYSGNEAEICRLYEAPHSIAYIAFRMGITGRSVLNKLERAGVRKPGDPTPVPCPTPYEICVMGRRDAMKYKRILYWHFRNISVHHIANMVGCATSTIYRTLESFGIMPERYGRLSDSKRRMIEWVAANKESYRSRIDATIRQVEKDIADRRLRKRANTIKLREALTAVLNDRQCRRKLANV